MSTSVTETAEYSHAPLPTRGQDGDTIYMDGGSAPQWPLWQRLYNRTAHHDHALLNHIQWSGDFAVTGTAPNSFTVTIGAINSTNLYDDTADMVLSYAGGTINQTKVEGGGGTLTAAAQWWYVYAFVNSGAIDFEISTTAPVASRAYKSGSQGAKRNYLGCFRTLSTGVPIPMRACRGRYLYNFSASAGADTRVLNAGNATSNTAVDLAALVPPHARIATLRAEVVSTTNGAINYAYLRTEGEAGADEINIPVHSTFAMSSVLVTDIITDGDQDVAYRVSNLTSAPTLTLFVLGFYE